jgi:hypothetical protein
MTTEELKTLYRLLTKWVFDPAWNKASREWATIVEARRQCAIDLHQAGVDADDLDTPPAP